MLLDFSKYEFPEQHCSPTTDFDGEVLQTLQKWRSQDEFTIQTSGSTGKPKAITHSKEHMLNSAKMTGDFFQFCQGQSALLCLPVSKIGGMMMLIRAMVWKMKLYILPPKLRLDLDVVPQIDFAPLLPIQAIENFPQLAKIKTVLLGGASVSTELFGKIQKHKSQFFLSYGMTETISHIGLCNLQKEQNCYEVFEGVQVATNSERSLNITALKLGFENLQTNDIVELISDNKFRFLGRYDNVINSGGLKIIAEEIEKQLQNYIDEPFYIKGTADEKLGESVTLFVESEKWQDDKICTLKKHFENITPKQAIPRKIIFQAKFYYTKTGKIVK